MKKEFKQYFKDFAMIISFAVILVVFFFSVSAFFDTAKLIPSTFLDSNLTNLDDIIMNLENELSMLSPTTPEYMIKLNSIEYYKFISKLNPLPNVLSSFSNINTEGLIFLIGKRQTYLSIFSYFDEVFPVITLLIASITIFSASHFISSDFKSGYAITEISNLGPDKYIKRKIKYQLITYILATLILLIPSIIYLSFIKEDTEIVVFNNSHLFFYSLTKTQLIIYYFGTLFINTFAVLMFSTIIPFYIRNNYSTLLSIGFALLFIAPNSTMFGNPLSYGFEALIIYYIVKTLVFLIPITLIIVYMKKKNKWSYI